jgi:hypothetical protein
LSDGAVFIIILLVLIIVYVVGFVSFNKFKRQATGLDLIPHRFFWISLFSYVLDGGKFIVAKVTGKSGYSTVK